MKKKTWIVIAVIAGVIVLALIALPLLANVDSFRPVIQSQLTSALGREVTIGHLSLSLMAGGITADDITIADDPAFSNTPFLHAKSLDVGVDLWPMLFSRSLKVNSLTLEEPEVTLLHSSAGPWNFSSLGNTSAPAAKPGKKGRAAPAAPAAPSSSSANFSVGKLKIVNGKITVGQPGRGARRTYENVNLEASNISYDSVIPFTLDAVTPGGGKLNVEGKAGPINREDTAQTPLEATTKIEHMDLGATGFLDPSSGIAGILDYTGSVKSDGKTAHSQGTATVDKLKAVKSGQPARAPVKLNYATDYDFKREAGTLTQGDVRFGASAAKLSGSYNSRGESTVVNMNLRGDGLPVGDVEGVLPAFGVVLPPGSRLEGGTANANLNLQGPLDHLVITGPVNVNNTRLAGFNLGSKMSGLAALAGIRAGGADTIIQSMSSTLRVAPEGIRADNLNIVVPDIGTMTGGGTIGANNALNFKMAAKLINGGGLVGGMGQILSMGQQKSGGAIPFLIQGTTSAPIFVPDVAGQLTNTVGAPAQGVGGILGGLFGGKQQQQTQKKPQ
ncbi:MAG TPA: AsmA family protein [Terriglobales bacterium]|jgi:AsmA protein|nr:AsmA family protein [Terriglobales bacterium]